MSEDNKGTVVLGVAASDAHAVANHLISHALRAKGFDVVNLGVCTSVAEFADAAMAHRDVLAVVIGSLNGHVHEDLRDLRAARESGAIDCPVIVGGNLSVGSTKNASDIERLHALGVDHVLTGLADLYVLLDDISTRQRVPVRVAAS